MSRITGSGRHGKSYKNTTEESSGGSTSFMRICSEDCGCESFVKGHGHAFKFSVLRAV